jgi:hypothetical protein
VEAFASYMTYRLNNLFISSERLWEGNWEKNAPIKGA